MRKSGCIRVWLLAVLLLSGCSARYTQQVADDLWSGWETSEVLMQQAYPNEPPLILVHGWNGGEFTWPSPERLLALEERWHRDIYLFTYRTGLFANRYPPLEVIEEQLDRYIAPYEQVDIIAHSMGGLLVRQYLAHHETSRIRRVLFMATPHFGSTAAQILMGLGSALPEGNIQAIEILPGSDFLWRLNGYQGSELRDVEVLNVFSDAPKLMNSDFVVPPRSAYLPWAANVQISGTHQQLPKLIDQLPMVEAFIQQGGIPDRLAGVPDEHEAWLRITTTNGASLKLVSGLYRGLDEQGKPSSSMIDECCGSKRTGLYHTGENTIVITDIDPRFSYEFSGARGNGAVLRLQGEDLLRPDQPVVMMDIHNNAAQAVPANVSP